MEDKVKKCVELKFECNKLSENVYGSKQFKDEEIEEIRKSINRKLEIVLNFLKRRI